MSCLFRNQFRLLYLIVVLVGSTVSAQDSSTTNVAPKDTLISFEAVHNIKQKHNAKELNQEPDASFFNKVINFFKFSKSKQTLYKENPVFHSHRTDLKYYLDNFLNENSYISEQDWTDLQKISIDSYVLDSSDYSNKFVYAFHPYWMGNIYYNYTFPLYDRIAYYGYIIDPRNGSDLSSGGGIIAHSYSNSPIHHYSYKYGVKVDLCVASYEPYYNVKIFSDSKKSKKIRSNLITNVVNLVKNRGSGVCFDIQKVPVKYKHNYIDLIIEIINQLNLDSSSSSKDYEFTMILPRYDVGFPYHMSVDDYQKLKPLINHWIFQGESNYGITKEMLEAKADTNWNYWAIDSEINGYPHELFDKMLLEIPFYTNFGSLKDDELVIQPTPYKNLVELDSASASNFRKGLIDKLYYARKKGLKGVAVWAISYDKSTFDLTSILKNYASEKDLNIDPTTVNYFANILEDSRQENESKVGTMVSNLNKFFNNSIIQPAYELIDVELPESHPFSFANKIKPNKIQFHHIIIFSLGLLLMFAILGFVIALFYEGTREVIISKGYLLQLLPLLIVVLLAILLQWLDLIGDNHYVFSIGVLIGLVVAYVIGFKKQKRQKERRP